MLDKYVKTLQLNFHILRRNIKQPIYTIKKSVSQIYPSVHSTEDKACSLATPTTLLNFPKENINSL